MFRRRSLFFDKMRGRLYATASAPYASRSLFADRTVKDKIYRFIRGLP